MCWYLFLPKGRYSGHSIPRPNTVYFPLRSAALLSTFFLSFILIPTQFIFLFVPLRYFQFSFFHSFSSQHYEHSLFSFSFRCATFNFPSFIHSHPNTVYFSLPSAALLSTFILSFNSVLPIFRIFAEIRNFVLPGNFCTWFSNFRKKILKKKFVFVKKFFP